MKGKIGAEKTAFLLKTFKKGEKIGKNGRMISSNGLIIIEMVSSETVDRGTVLFILKGGDMFEWYLSWCFWGSIW